jgi:hypothetical protein
LGFFAELGFFSGDRCHLFPFASLQDQQIGFRLRFPAVRLAMAAAALDKPLLFNFRLCNVYLAGDLRIRSLQEVSAAGHQLRLVAKFCDQRFESPACPLPPDSKVPFDGFPVQLSASGSCEVASNSDCSALEGDFVLELWHLRPKPDPNTLLGSVTVDLFTVATGPASHALPFDLDKRRTKTTGGLAAHFALHFAQVTEITFSFRILQLKNLQDATRLQKKKSPEDKICSCTPCKQAIWVFLTLCPPF